MVCISNSELRLSEILEPSSRISSIFVTSMTKRSLCYNVGSGEVALFELNGLEFGVELGFDIVGDSAFSVANSSSQNSTPLPILYSILSLSK